MLHCLNTSGNSDMTTVLETQRAWLRWQQEQEQEQCYFSGTGFNSAESKPTHSSIGKESFRKRKANRFVAENDNKDKRIKVGADDRESKITNSNNRQGCEDSEVEKPDYIHVRARRGQATDSHSLAERVRREKISERMKYLQDLVPGCNKVAGKAGMLDEIINYVLSLQRQVEFLSMKLATVNPRFDSNIDDLFEKEFNPPQQIVSYGGLDMGININPSDMGLRRTITAPETFLDSSSFTQILPSSTTWEGDFQCLYNLDFHQALATSFPSQLLTGLVEPSNLMMEM